MGAGLGTRKNADRGRPDVITCVRFTGRKSGLGRYQQGRSCVGDRVRSRRREEELSAVLRMQAVQRLACLLLVLDRQAPEPEERDGGQGIHTHSLQYAEGIGKDGVGAVGRRRSGVAVDYEHNAVVRSGELHRLKRAG